MYRLIETKTYTKRAIKFFKKRPNLLNKYEKILSILESNPYHPSLRLHKLQGGLKKFYSISLDMEFRIIVDFIIIDKKIFLIDIGNHDKVY